MKGLTEDLMGAVMVKGVGLGQSNCCYVYKGVVDTTLLS